MSVSLVCPRCGVFVCPEDKVLPIFRLTTLNHLKSLFRGLCGIRRKSIKFINDVLLSRLSRRYFKTFAGSLQFIHRGQEGKTSHDLTQRCGAEVVKLCLGALFKRARLRMIQLLRETVHVG